MKTIKLKTGLRTYNIFIGSGILSKIGLLLKKINPGKDACIITNASLKNRFGARLKKYLERNGFSVKFFLVPDAETSKSLNIASKVISSIANYDKSRKIFVVALGGGVIGDVAGFVASIYKRGIPFIQIPTTLLAQVDSSIGGKTGVDLTHGKNLLGTFYQPSLVLSDIDLLKSLDKRQIRSGLAEVIKYGAITDAGLFQFLENHTKRILGQDKKSLEFVVSRCAELKARIVQLDEREEKGIRTILNFGHTIGHAIEAACGYHKFGHGEAIALGMLVSCDLSLKLRLISKKDCLRIENLIKKTGLPLKAKKVSAQKIIKAHYRDKKFLGAKNKFVLLTEIGKTKIIRDIDLKIIKDSLKKIF